jgi:hypothetical protein
VIWLLSTVPTHLAILPFPFCHVEFPSAPPKKPLLSLVVAASGLLSVPA